MSRIDINIKVLDEIVKRFSDEIEKEVAESVLMEIKHTQAFKDRKGRLRRSMHIVEGKKGGRLIKVSAFYGVYVELGYGIYKKGVRKAIVPAKPFMRPAARNVPKKLEEVSARIAREQGLL